MPLRGTAQLARYVSRGKMKTKFFITFLILLFSSLSYAGDEVEIKGILEWSSEKQTLKDCETGRIYWVRVLASNPYAHLSNRVDELKKQNQSIIAKFSGEVKMGQPSSGPQYHVDGILYVHQIISVESGVRAE